ncbi:hypothetical protein QJS10_CPB21g01261 [Acorus calamus]|uniref:BZIP domain-containing protein n=1 Tax=Acorus calamus TaxID=4465 RepID=A0AAV9C5M2_ACOCL|nr:hypothetical protein QJS10_CPB21g01261 [Acorus calamus]
MRGNYQFDGGVGVGGHDAGLLSDDDFDAWITTLLEEDFDMTPIDIDMGGSNILDNKNKRKKSRHTKEQIQALNSYISPLSLLFFFIQFDELRKENVTLREKIRIIHQDLNRAFLTSQHVQRYTGIGTSDSSLLSAVSGPSSLFNVLESGLYQHILQRSPSSLKEMHHSRISSLSLHL